MGDTSIHLIVQNMPEAVYSLGALITNLLAIKGLSRLRAGLRAQIKGLTIIIDLICNLLVSPQSHLCGHLTQHTCPLKVSPLPCHQDIHLHLPLPVPASISNIRKHPKLHSCHLEYCTILTNSSVTGHKALWSEEFVLLSQVTLPSKDSDTQFSGLFEPKFIPKWKFQKHNLPCHAVWRRLKSCPSLHGGHRSQATKSWVK